MSTKRFVYLSIFSAATLSLVTALPAAAHVSVQPGQANQGGYAKLAFRVPNESATAGTVKLSVTFPTDTPLASVRTRPTAGWTAEITREKLATPIRQGEREITEIVSTVTWTAQPGVRIGPNEFTEFEISTGPLPTAERMLFPTVQTYDDGKVVSWDAPPPADGADEPDHPAPVLTLVTAPAEGDGHGAAAAAGKDTAAGAEVEQVASTSETASAGRDDTARWLGGIGLAVGALGIGLAAGALLATRRRGTGPA
jgi:periplasmic copper chaperone A